MPDVNALNVLIQIWSRDVGKILSQGENVVALVIAGKNYLDCKDDKFDHIRIIYQLLY